MIGNILNGNMIHIKGKDYDRYVLTKSGFKILSEDENGNIKSVQNLDDEEIISI